MTYKLKSGFVLRKMGPSFVAVPFGPRAIKIKGMISLTESGYLLWKAMQDGTDTLEGLADILVKEYGIPQETAEADTRAFLEGLKEQGALEVLA